jgi:hypothetical protein
MRRWKAEPRSPRNCRVVRACVSFGANEECWYERASRVVRAVYIELIFVRNEM